MESGGIRKAYEVSSSINSYFLSYAVGRDMLILHS
jgi:hypothetical protein